MESLYTAEALSTGHGRTGRVDTPDGSLGLVMAPPAALGGSGQGSNPEQLFAAGYAACFHSALHAVARSQKLSIVDSSVGGRVHLHREGQGFKLSVELEVVLPNIPQEQAQALADAAHQVCPYSNATQGNIQVVINVSDD